MFGIRIVTKKKLRQIERNARDKAIAAIVDLLRKKESIYLEPVTLIGNGQTIHNCVFFGIGDDAALTVATIEKLRERWEASKESNGNVGLAIEPKEIFDADA